MLDKAACSSEISLPVISVVTFSIDSSSLSNTPTLSPSRSTDTLLHTASTSSSLWLTKRVGHPVVSQFVDDVQQGVDLVLGQACGWLVHDDQPCIARECPRNGHALLLRSRQPPDDGLQIQRNAQPIEGLLRGAAGVLPLHESRSVTDHLTDCYVLFHGQVGEQRQVLVDDLDALAD